jgi:hypothetical protein
MDSLRERIWSQYLLEWAQSQAKVFHYPFTFG